MKKNSVLIFCLFALLAPGFGQNTLRALDPELKNYDYPFPVDFLHFTSQGESLRMAYMDVRPKQPNGKTVLLLHGKNFSAAYWEQTAKTLSDNGFRVVLPDQIGFGKSSKPAHIQYSFQWLAGNTAMLLDTLGIQKVTVLGHSMGGMLATRFALLYPERVDGLVLENPIGLEDWKVKVPYQTVDAWYKTELQQNYDKIKKYQTDNYYHGDWKPEYERWVTLPAGWTMHPDYARVAWNSALTYDMIFTQPVCYEFGNLKVPTLLIIGQLDRTALGKNLVSPEVRATLGDYPKLGRTTARAIIGAKLVELDGVGHLPHIEAFERFIGPLLEFLQR